MREHVFARAGMTDAGVFHMREVAPGPPVAEGWDPVREGDEGVVTGWRQNVYSYPPIGSPDGGAHCTAADLVRFVDALRGGELWNAFGLEVAVRTDGSVSSRWKDGVNAGASAFVEHFPELDLTVAVVANSEAGVWPAWEVVGETLDLTRPG